MLTTALSIEACGRGKRVRFFRITELVTQMIEPTISATWAGSGSNWRDSTCWCLMNSATDNAVAG